MTHDSHHTAAPIPRPSTAASPNCTQSRRHIRFGIRSAAPTKIAAPPAPARSLHTERIALPANKRTSRHAQLAASIYRYAQMRCAGRTSRFKNLRKHGYGMVTLGLSTALFEICHCGGCYVVMCVEDLGYYSFPADAAAASATRPTTMSSSPSNLSR